MGRFWSKVNISASGCLEWHAYLTPDGYGKFWFGTSMVLAHRFAYQALNGPIPAGLELDHTCVNPKCVRPDHLEPVTHRENVRRGTSPSVRHSTKTHCPKGHPYDAANTYVRPSNNSRQCRTCRAEQIRAWKSSKAKERQP
jgi:hypothetical protein